MKDKEKNMIVTFFSNSRVLASLFATLVWSMKLSTEKKKQSKTTVRKNPFYTKQPYRIEVYTFGGGVGFFILWMASSGCVVV